MLKILAKKKSKSYYLTGMSNLFDIKKTINFKKNNFDIKNNLTLLHCIKLPNKYP